MQRPIKMLMSGLASLLVIACVAWLLLAAIGKAKDFAGATRPVAYWIGDGFAGTIGVLTIGIEVAIAAWLTVGYRRSLAIGSALALHVVFGLWLIFLAVAGPSVGCGCGKTGLSWFDVSDARGGLWRISILLGVLCMAWIGNRLGSAD